jgi:peptidoglycan/xylan/chitin deacetylase (PgdA/CDA1 family)
MSRFLQRVVAAAMHATRLSAAVRYAQRDALAIVCYHRVLPTAERAASPFPDLAVTPEAFDAHLALFAKHYECLTLRDAVEKLQRGGCSQPLLAITFDDGYWDNHAHALPLLEKHHARATFFVVTSPVGTREPIWCDQLARTADYLAERDLAPVAWIGSHEELPAWIARQPLAACKRPGAELVRAAKSLAPPLRRELVAMAAERAASAGYRDQGADGLMTVEQLRDLAAHGHEVASHTCTHPILPLLPPGELARELGESKSALEQMLGGEVVSIAYPNGDYDEAVVRAAREARYLNAATTKPGLNSQAADRLALRRAFISQERLGSAAGAANLLEMELNGAAEWLFLRKLRARRRNSGAIEA